MAKDVDNGVVKLVWFDAGFNKFRSIEGNVKTTLDKRIKEQLNIISSSKKTP